MHKWENVHGEIRTLELENEDGTTTKVRRYYIEVEHNDEVFYAGAQAPQDEAEAHPELVSMMLNEMVDRIEANITQKELASDRIDD